MCPSCDRRAYGLLLVAAWCWGSATSQLTLFAVVLRSHGFADPLIAAILSTATVAVAVAALVSGPLVSRVGAVGTLLIGGLLASAAIAALPFAVVAAPLVALAMLGRGFGFGLFTPAGQLFAKAHARDDDQVRAVGMFTAMFLLPTCFGPALGEWALRRLGEHGFFLLALLPIVLGVLVVTQLPRHQETPAPPDTAGYLRLLRDRRLWLANVTVMQSGLAYAFASSFLPLLLIEAGTPVAAFFTPFAVVLLTTRFLGLTVLQRLAPPHLAALGLTASATGLAILAGVATPLWAGLAGGLMGLGYAVLHPTCVEWSARLYPPAARARPVALINASFTVGSLLAVQVTGVALGSLGWTGILRLLAVLVLMVLAVVAYHSLAVPSHRIT